MLLQRQLVRPAVIVTVLCLIYALVLVATQEDGALTLVTIGTRFSEGIAAEDGGTEGYDGQFVYFIARDWTAAEPLLDVPAYRFQRILLSVGGRVLAFGVTDLLPWALLLVNLASLFAGTALLERLLTRQDASRWYALGYGLSLGAFGATRLTLPEPLAYALTIGALVFAFHDRPLISAAIFALAAFAKETTLVVAAGYGLYLLSQRRWQDAVLFGLISLLPFVIWQFVLIQLFGTPGVGSGGALATSFELIPFAGVIRILTEGGLAVFAVLGIILIPFVLIPVIWSLWQIWRDLRANDMTIYTWLLLTSAIIMPFIPFSTYREPVAILRFIIGLQIAVILYAAHKRSRRALLNSTIWALTSIFVIFSDVGSG